MKKIIAGLCLAIYLVTMLLLSCNKDRQLTTKQTSLIEKAEQWYTASIKEAAKSPLATKPNWENAHFFTSAGGEQLIVVPADKENKTSNPKYGMLTSFVFVSDGSKINSGNILQILGENDALKQQGQNLFAKYQTLSFKGVRDGALIIYDINHEYLDGRNIKDEKVSSDIGAQMSAAGTNPLANSILVNGTKVSSGNIQNSSNRFSAPILSATKNAISTYGEQGEAQNCTDWYWTTWNVNTGEILSQTYAYSTCEKSSSGSSSTVNASLNAPPPCNSSFHFVTKISGSITEPKFEGGWQVAAVQGIHYNLVSNYYPPVRIEMPLLYFGLPVIKKEGTNSYVNFSYEVAQQIAKNAVAKAEEAAKNLYKLWPPDVETRVAQVYRATISSEMAKFGGLVTERTPGTGLAVPAADVTTATYPVIWGLGC